jgi:hypothetical protein
MKKLLQSSLISSLLLTAGLASLAATPSSDRDAPTARLTVYVYNYAEVPASILEGTRKEASRILARAGVEVLWVECPVGKALPNPSCEHPVRPNEIWLRILPRPNKAMKTIARDIGGIAYRVGEDTGSGLIAVFYDSVEEIAEQFNVSKGVVLGLAATHEMGHLLLPSGAHAGRGIMQARLSRPEWGQAARGELVFAAEESKQMTTSILSSMKQQEIVARAELKSAD